MKLKNEARERELAPEGTHNAVCIQILDLGTQVSEKWKSEMRQCSVGFELVDEMNSEGEPFVVFKKYNLPGLGPKANLAKDLKAWLGIVVEKDDEIDLDQTILGKSCNITITYSEPDENDKVYDNITAITSPVKDPRTKKVPVFKAKNEIQSCWLTKDDFNEDMYNGLVDWLKEKIAGTKEYKALLQSTAKGSKPGKALPPAKGKGKSRR